MNGQFKIDPDSAAADAYLAETDNNGALDVAIDKLLAGPLAEDEEQDGERWDGQS